MKFVVGESGLLGSWFPVSWSGVEWLLVKLITSNFLSWFFADGNLKKRIVISLVI